MSEGSTIPDPQTLERLGEWVGESRYLSAWEVAKAHAPLKAWPGPEGRAVAARLAGGLGDRRLQCVLQFLNARRHPEHGRAFMSWALRRIGRIGPLEVLAMVDSRSRSGAQMEAPDRADLLALKGWLHGRLRDFEPAYAAVDEALGILPDGSWVHVQRSEILQFEDRYEEALEAAREALRHRPHYPPAVLQFSECLVHCGRDDEAIDALEEAHEATECAAFAGELVNFFSEREDHVRALHYLEEHVARSPLLDRRGWRWIERRRADMYYLAGNYEACLEQCDKAGDGYHKRIAANMRRPGALEAKRKRLAVPFVRQHNVTCAPATLASLAAYWGLHFDHLAIAEAICYNGTPWHKEREWCEAQGLIAKELRLTREILIALIDREVPFTLTTQAVTSGHLQACIGYDDRQGVVLLRDPTERHFGEVILEGLLEDHPVQGPRCMLLLPRSEEGRLEGLTLPDAEVYDAYHEISVALDLHDRDRARTALGRMPADHPLTGFAEYRLASYDRHPAAELRAVGALVERFPENAPLRYTKLQILQRLPDPAGEGKLLRAEMARESCDPVFLSEMGEYLLRDARRLPLAEYHLRKAVRTRPSTGSVYASLAFCRWKQRRFDEATALRRIASCLEDGWEGYASAFAQACRVIGRPEEGVRFLRKRAERLGGRNGGPWQTLAEELDSQRRETEARALLEEAMTIRPNDGGLLLATGRFLITWGERARGEALMARARGRIEDSQWLRASAQMAGFLGRRKQAIDHWRELAAREPHSEEVHRNLASLLADEAGAAEARGYLEEVVRAHPRNPALWSLKAEWDEGLGPAHAIRALETARELDPNSLWVIRELAVQRSRLGEGERALEDARDAVVKDPHSPCSHGILGNVLEDMGRKEEARLSYETAVRLDIDYTFATRRLVKLASDRQEMLRVLAFVESEMKGQVSDGSIVPEYRDLAYQHLDPETLLSQLRGFCGERPDLWQTWGARSQQALDMSLPGEALECAREMTERFPLLPRAWVELGKVHRAAGRHAEELAALERAVDLSPAWGWAARQLAEVQERLGRYEDAQRVLERALHHEPLAGANYGCLGSLLWKLGRTREAFEQLLRGMERCPSYDWGWSTLSEWAVTLQREDEVAAALRSHDEACGHAAGWWVTVADVLHQLNRTGEAIAAASQGLERFAGHPDLLEKKVWLIASAGRIEEALALCEEALRQETPLRGLRGRHAWLLMQSGRPKEALQLMTALVEAEPDYTWGLRQLAGWLSDRREWKALGDVARQWVRQAPGTAAAHGYLGEAEVELGNRDAAKSALSKAFSLDPEYAYGGRRVLTYQIEDKELDAAAETLKTLRHYVPSPEITADAIELAVARSDAEEAERCAVELLGDPGATVALLGWVRTLFEKGGWKRQWEALLDRRVADGASSRVVCEAWLRSLPERKKLRAGTKYLDGIREDADRAAEGWVALLNEAAVESNAKRVRRWIRKRREWFRSRTDLWSAAGNALVEMKLHREGRDWLKDWAERNGAPPGALFNYALAAEHEGGWQAGAAARAAALEREPAGPLAGALRAVVSVESFLEGDVERAARIGDQVEVERLKPYYQGYFILYESLAAARRGDVTRAEARYQAALGIYTRWKPERGIESLFESTAAELARDVPWANGKRRRILRRWGDYRKRTAPDNPWKWPAIFVTIYVVVRLLSELAG